MLGNVGDIQRYSNSSERCVMVSSSGAMSVPATEIPLEKSRKNSLNKTSSAIIAQMSNQLMCTTQTAQILAKTHEFIATKINSN